MLTAEQKQLLQQMVNTGEWARSVLEAEDQIEDNTLEAPFKVESYTMASGLWNLRNIRKLLINGFSEQDLKQVWIDIPEFAELKNRTARLNNVIDMADMLIDHAERKLCMEELLSWCKTYNPNRFESGGPYEHER